MSSTSHDSGSIKSAYALIVGISEYSDVRIPKLNFTHADAKEFCNLLLDPKRAGFLEENVKLLLNEKATLFNIKDAISGWLFQRSTEDSTVLIFFAGHGGTESDKTGTETDGISKYLLPWDADIDNLFASALSNAEFHRLLKTVKSKRLVIFMDACYAGGLIEKGARDVGIMENPYKRLSEGEGRVVIAAAKPNQRSWENPSIGHGIFTYHLLEALRGKADFDNDGYISILEVYKYLEREVPKSVRLLAQSIQEPFMLCEEISEDIKLTANAERIAELNKLKEEEERRLKEKIQAKRSKLFDLYNNKEELPSEIYHEALRILEKNPEEMPLKESDLAEEIDLLLEEKISTKKFIKDWKLIIDSKDEEGDTRGDEGTSGHSPTTEPEGTIIIQDPEPKEKYCIYCGTKISSKNRFCIGCGRPIPK